MRRLLPFIIGLAVLLVDRLGKYLALAGHDLHAGIFQFLLFKNRGLVFSLPTPYPVAVALMLLGLAAVVIMMWRWRQPQVFSAWSAALLSAGALSNVIDRLHYGYIIDYLWAGKWMPIFNIADLALTAGLIILIVNPKTKPTTIDKPPAVR